MVGADDVTARFKELEQLNAKNIEENTKVKTRVEVAINHITTILNSSPEKIDIDLDTDKLYDPNYVNQLINTLNQKIAELQQKFNSLYEKSKSILEE